MLPLPHQRGLDVVEAEPDGISTGADAETAIVLLHHDVERELPVLRAALKTDAFYIGCLGSRRTHARRRDRLRQEGYSPGQLDRIHAPIGLFGPAREARVSRAETSSARCCRQAGRPSHPFQPPRILMGRQDTRLSKLRRVDGSFPARRLHNHPQ
ncbi:XdhC family protein [Brucella endophytica]|uniref:XdhC family protein n=1 Tax=Brucella endophytica TaxID=1963359 RepID=UPI00166D3D00|nr:XdhC family protein [Brucella endophytica]